MMAKRSPFGSHEKSVTASVKGTSTMIRRSESIQAPTFEFYNFYWEVFLANTEDFEIAEDGLLCLCVPVNLDAQEVAQVLPVKLTLIACECRVKRMKKKPTNLCNIEQVLLSQDATAGEINDSDTRWLIGDLRGPVRKQILFRLLAGS